MLQPLEFRIEKQCTIIEYGICMYVTLEINVNEIYKSLVLENVHERKRKFH
jgi:hypothetical protein